MARSRRRTPSVWQSVALYGALLAAGTLALESVDYLRVARMHSAGVYVALIAVAFLALGVAVGARVTAPPPSAAFDANPNAQASLGISPRELTVLHAIAAGRSTKEIAADLNVSPNTVKTHVARLFEKLDATRRTDAVNKARELGIVR